LLKRCWNPIKERGKSVMTAAQAWCVPDMFYRGSTLAATTFWTTGHKGIRLSCNSVQRSSIPVQQASQRLELVSVDR
jgi:hypothetical protein